MYGEPSREYWADKKREVKLSHVVATRIMEQAKAEGNGMVGWIWEQERKRLAAMFWEFKRKAES